MKKILLIIAFTVIIFQMVVLAIAIDVGSPAINRALTQGTYTTMGLTNPANATGIITSVEIWVNNDVSNCEIATFYLVSGTNYSTRDTHFIGSIASGSKHTSSGLSLEVQSGDYLGIYYTSGALERSGTGGSGIRFATSDQIPCSNVEFANYWAGDLISLYGTGATVGEEDNAIFFGMNF